MRTTDTLIIGAGQAGLALSRCLTAFDHEHLVVERGRVGERWRSERWDSLRLLTPNWMTRLPHWGYDGNDPEGFMTAAEVAAFFDRYAESFDAPVLEETNVLRVRRSADRFAVTTDQGEFTAANVVIATGWCDKAAVPSAARHLATDLLQVSADSYRRPEDLPDGGVLVVGASATGVQLAHELAASGRSVTIAVGGHNRMPRRYRGMDSFWWLDQMGTFDKTIDDLDDIDAARTEPSVQIVGTAEQRNIDLTTLQRAGVRLAGRLTGAAGHRVALATNLDEVIAAADSRMTGVLARIDAYIEMNGLSGEVLPADRLARVDLGHHHHDAVHHASSLDLHAAGVRSVVWATGYRRAYGWLDLPILDGRGEISQRRGITPVPGAYVLGQRFQHFRNSNFIDGVGRDAVFIAHRIAGALSSHLSPRPHHLPRKQCSP